LYARHIVWWKGVFRVDYRWCRCSPPFASLQLSRGGISLTLSCSRYVTLTTPWIEQNHACVACSHMQSDLSAHPP
jgi:hypothetical protein